MNRKAQGLSLNVIVIAVLVLLALVILAFIFTNKMHIFGKGIQSCKSKHGVCREECNRYEVEVGDHSNTDCEYKCCMPIYNEHRQ